MTDSGQFKEGDLVELKSGGPIMTVNAVADRSNAGARWVRCQWFDRAKLHSGQFNEDELVLVEQE